MVAAVLASQGVGLVATLIVLMVSGEAGPTQDALVWGTLAGASGLAGVGFFYLALARGTMGVVAPLAALIGAGVPVIVAVIGGESVSEVRLAGMGMALAAVVLISLPGRSRDDAERRSLRIDMGDLPLVLLTGLGFAGFFLGIDRASVDGSTWWPLTFVRIAGIVLIGGTFLVLVARVKEGSLRRRSAVVLGVDRLRGSGRSFASILPLFLLIGMGDLGGNVFFVFASHADALSVAVVLASLYPVITTLLAVAFLHERLRPIQILGVVLATVSVPLLR